MKKRIKDWKEVSLVLAETQVLSWRRLALALGVPRSTMSDHLRKYYKGAQ